MYKCTYVIFLGRALLLGFAVLQCSSKSYFQAILNVKITYLWARPIYVFS